MTIELHYNIFSPPARAALITLKHLRIDAKLIVVDLQNGGNRTHEYLKLNPAHTVPTLVDNGFALFESRAILTYLVSKYGAKTSLYPSELQARANVDKIIYFDVSSFFPALRNAYRRIYQKQELTSEILDELKDKVNILETILGNERFLTGDKITVADICVSASVPNLKMFVSQFYSDKMQKWYQRVVDAVLEVGEINDQVEKIARELFKKA